MNNTSIDLDTAQQKFQDFLKKQGRATATIVAYTNDIAQLIDYLRKRQITQANYVTLEHIEGFKEYLKENSYTDKSACRKLNSVRTFFRFLKTEGFIPDNPALAVPYPRYKPAAPRILSQLEYRALRDAARNDPRLAAVVELLLQTGMRIGELARLQLEDITDNEIKIRPYESHPERTVPLNKAAKMAVDRWLDFRPKTNSHNLLVTRTGKPFLTRNIRTVLSRLFRVAGLENVTINSLRHTFIAHQLMAGVSVNLIQQIVGHKRISTTERYLEFVKEKISPTPKLEEL